MDARPRNDLTPSSQAARRDRLTGRPRSPSSDRAYPAPPGSCDHEALGAQLAATRALLRASEETDVVAIVATLVRDLGGAVIPARLADPTRVLQVDVSFGRSEPMLPWADPVSVAGMRLGSLLPDVIEDAHLALTRLQAQVQRDDEASRDVLTGLLTRRALMRRLSQATSGQSVALFDLDEFKSVNDAHGHDVGDTVLRAVGALMSSAFRASDACGRYGGDEFVCLTSLPAASLVARCEVLAQRWREVRPSLATAVTLSVGVATVGEHGGRDALRRADRAMYRAKTEGRDRVVIDTSAAAEESA